MSETSPSRSLIPDSDLAPRKRPLPPPNHLDSDEKRAWRRLLANNEHLNSGGFETLIETYVRALIRARRADELVKKALLITTSDGTVKPNPAVGVLQACEGTLTRLASTLALSTGSRREAGRKAQAQPMKPPKAKAQPRKKGAPALRLA